MCVRSSFYVRVLKVVFFPLHLQEAEKAKAALDKKKVLGKKIVVDWARTDLGAVKKNVSVFSITTLPV